MKSFTLLFLAAALTSASSIACGGGVVPLSDRTDGPSPEASRRDQPGSSAGPTSSGVPCSFLHGQATLTSRKGDDDYASSAFRFEFASQDPAITRNEFDVLYSADMFIVNMITDDVSFIVDLGPIALREVPSTVDVDAFPVGQWGKHDAIQAQPEHTYFVRSVDGAGRLVAAFRVVRLAPGQHVGIEWIRSTSADTMTVPLACL